ncbi:MAG: thiamine pyrophosphate-binding protein [Rhodospirillales bacterium]|jgi:sulfopyruvate decarboxylase alpha subunit|nr:thiamine pyrophosphate-binding protein [Rhodospirillales bacterium]MDP7101139.1 thiamine pyrophosphate-binding protein [Rhodospirillales bacterium]HJO87970.1 thiamine pyrophosphate-binding protein [Rhodospirillales bacterium]|tara:strand:- start:762 stop:1328 length:567 start_codon:yes stop_codon:yes gene_type:complete
MTNKSPGGSFKEFNLDWSRGVLEVFKRAEIRHAAYVPDAGLEPLIDFCHGDEAIRATMLTSEQEGVGMLAGAWLGGDRGVLLMQSSGVGNCINALSLQASCQIPLVMLVTMRGEWAEFNPWQVPMGQAAQTCLEAQNVIVYRAEESGEVPDVVQAAIDFAFNSQVAVAVLLSQKMIGRKQWGGVSGDE